ncbi:peptidase M50 [Halothermothrix orenii H 168]|uniref:Peptidase M50 n=1 Tax=Halothermothrix orenii (strain H 168 / OCM 544 / DSM 9562) TaxID=373903 RepID=B8CXZ6_HALOH|nr:peptidase M50 [Halothermothrix orenii H 168]
MVVVVFALAGLFTEAIISIVLVITHEFIHLLVAYRLGYRPGKIELFPFGGMAEYSGLLEMNPGDEIKVAGAGPLYNLAMAGIFYLIYMLTPHNLYLLIVKYNLVLSFFNLIPALPLDGGRVFRALMVYNSGFKRGTLIAVKLAKILAISGAVMGGVCVLLNKSNLWVLLISFFVYGASLKEENQIVYRLVRYLTRRRQENINLTISPVVNKVVRGEMQVEEVIYHLNPVKYNIFIVLDSKMRLSGIITESQLIDSFFRLKKHNIKLNDIIRK